MIPKSIKIFDLKYKIEIGSLNEEWGVTDFDAQVITLGRNQTKKRMRQTLFHEIVHTVIISMKSAFDGVDSKKDMEEFVCDLLSIVWIEIGKNPKVKKYLVG